MNLRTWSTWLVGCVMALTPVVASAQAAAQAAPVRAMSAAPGLSGGEGGNSGPVTVTLAPATKADPILKTIVGQPKAPPTGDDPATRCILLSYRDLTGIKDAPAQMLSASVTPGKDGAPSLCQVDGYIAPQVGFTMWLPLENWNGKYLQTGCGGRCGKLLPDTCLIQYQRGYACLAHDLGHRSTTYDNVWAIDDVPAEIDFGFRATHVAAIVGKHITQSYYGRKPAHSYFIGASTGGRQALVAVQRFPKDFDGVIGGVAMARNPGLDPNEPMPAGGKLLWRDGRAVLTADEIRMVHGAVMRKCDAIDGLKDGIITDSKSCPFQPAELLCKAGNSASCLDQRQVDTLAEIYSGGTQRGSELGWIGAYVAQDNSKGRYIPKNEQGYSYPYSWVFNDSSNPDIRPFQKAGGKFILYGGWGDEVVNPIGTSGYYDAVENLVGSREETQSFFRTFMIPGQSHIPGNVGAESINYLYALEDWVEKGKAPDRLVGNKLKTITIMLGPIVLDKDMVPENVLYSRPHYPYPIQARYKGTGNPDDAASFAPWNPRTGRWMTNTR